MATYYQPHKRSRLRRVGAGAGAGTWYLYFDGVNDLVNCGSAATLDDLAAATLTIDAWVRADSVGASGVGRIVDKESSTATGFDFYVSASGLWAMAQATTDAISCSGNDEFSADGLWHHVTYCYANAGDRKIYLWIDGVPVASYAMQQAAAGAVVSDASYDFTIGNRSNATRTWHGGIGWVRLSNTDRYTPGVAFTPPTRLAPPAADGNTVEIWGMNDGSGSAVHAAINSDHNGTVTGATWMWG